jgi:hypothetical protein
MVDFSKRNHTRDTVSESTHQLSPEGHFAEATGMRVANRIHQDNG